MKKSILVFIVLLLLVIDIFKCGRVAGIIPLFLILVAAKIKRSKK